MGLKLHEVEDLNVGDPDVRQDAQVDCSQVLRLLG